MNRHTGKPLSGYPHLKQSIRDILTTPLGTRVMRRDYGSRLFELLDNPINKELKFELMVATAEALTKWEPRIAIERVGISAIQDGHVTLDIFGTIIPTGKAISLEGIFV